MKGQGEAERALVLLHMHNCFANDGYARLYTAHQLSVELNMEPKKMYRILNYLLDVGKVVKQKHFGYANEWRCLTGQERRRQEG